MSRQNSRERILDVTLALTRRRGGADVTMAEIAKAAQISRQAVYLHFADRADLLVALVRHQDEKRDLASELRKIVEAPNGIAAMRAMVALQASGNPTIWPVARAVDAVRRRDAAAERSWQDRLRHRLEGCRTIIGRLMEDGVLRGGLDPAEAADLLWTITSLRTWEDLVLGRGWKPAQYEARLNELLLATLTNVHESARPR